MPAIKLDGVAVDGITELIQDTYCISEILDIQAVFSLIIELLNLNKRVMRLTE